MERIGALRIRLRVKMTELSNLHIFMGVVPLGTMKSILKFLKYLMFNKNTDFSHMVLQ